MAPVFMCPTPNSKTPVQLNTQAEVEEFLQVNPCACEVLVSRNGKKPFFEYQIKSATRLTEVEILQHRCECENDLEMIVNSQNYPRLRICGIMCTFQDGPMWLTHFRFVVTGTQLDDYVIQLRKITDGTIFNKAPSNVLSFRGATLLGDSSWLDVCAQAQDDDSLVWVVKNADLMGYEREKIEFEKTHLKIMNPFGFVRLTQGGTQLMNRAILYQMNENKLMKDEPFVKRWLKDPNMRTYERLDFLPPPTSCPEDVFNTWQGFAAQNITETTGTAAVFIDHVEALFGDQAGYVFKWLANIVQYPGRKTEVALVIIGRQGAGKSSVFEHVMKKVIGGEYFGHTCSPDKDLFSQFAPLTNSKIMVVVDDFNVGTIKVNSDQFKTFITGETVQYEAKGIMRCTLNNCCNFVIIHNKPDPVKLDSDDRRYAVLECSNKFYKNVEYFNQFRKYANEPCNIRAVYDYLMGIDISQTNFQAERPMTDIYKRVKSLSADKELLFIYHKVQKAATETIRIKSSDMFDEYQDWVVSCRFSDYKPKNKYTLRPALDKIQGVNIETGHAGTYTWIIECREVIKGIEDQGYDVYDLSG